MVSAGKDSIPSSALAGTDDDWHTVIYSGISDFSKVKFEPVGRWFEKLHASAEYGDHGTNFVEDEKSSEESSSDEEEYEDNSEYLRSLDPKDWKNQDHYAVLGLKKKRFFAKDEEIKKAYRKIVLVHHPDKRKSAGENIKDLDHDYYSCITKAYEILGNPVKRRSYDSVDPEFSDIIPPANSHSKENFFEVFQPVFAANSRWSVKQPVPNLGNSDDTVEKVEEFYTFWYNFESWREFSYLDEEEKEKGENREERKWIEKQNKIARQRRKKEEMGRIRQLTDNAYSCDPRIARFKEEERQRKIAQKKAKQEAARIKAEEEEKKRQEQLEAERRLKEKEEEEEKMKREKEKKEKEATKKQLKKERKTLQHLCEKYDYFAKSDTERLENLKEVDRLSKLLSLEKLQELNAALENEDESNKRNIFLRHVEMINKQLETENKQLLASAQRSGISKDKSRSQKPWSHDDLQLLVKAVNLFPAGTNSRWEAIAVFLSQHSSSNIERTAKEVLDKAKELQKQSADLREQVNKNAYENLEKTQKTVTVSVKDQSAPTDRFETPAEQLGINPEPWTSDEQQLFEQALKTYPANTPERWDKIAGCVPGRSKKDCMKRYKDLVEMVKAKKSAQATAAQKGKK